MAQPLVALGVQNPQINALGAFTEGRQSQMQAQRFQRQEAEAAMQTIGSIALGVMGGDLEGAPNPQRWEEGLNYLKSMGLDVEKYRGRSDLAPIVARASLDSMQQMSLAKSDRDYEFAVKRFEESVRQHDQEMGLRRQQMAQSAATSDAGSLQPIYGTDESGNPVLLQMTKSGAARQVSTPEGVQISTGVDKVDLGTEWGLLDKRSGQIVGKLPKENFQESYDKASGSEMGKQTAQAEMDLGGAVQKADDSIRLIDEALQHPGLEAAVGLSSKIDPRNYMAGTQATDFNVRIKQLQGGAFLQAFESLKGGGQITEVEGQKATEAIARLSTAQSEDGFRQSLSELRDILENGKRRAMEKAGVSKPQESSGNAITTQEEYDALPSGAVFIFNGQRGRKP